jgi:beta-glucosidase
MEERTYRYFTGNPLYPFGYGLSYSKFYYYDAWVTPTIKAGDEQGVRVTKNTEFDPDRLIAGKGDS